MLRTSYNILCSLSNQPLAHHKHFRFSGRNMSSLSRSEVMVALQGDIDSVWAHQVLVAATMDHQLKCFFTDIHVLREMSNIRDALNSLQQGAWNFRNAATIDEGIFMITLFCSCCCILRASLRCWPGFSLKASVGFSKTKTPTAGLMAHKFHKGTLNDELNSDLVVYPASLLCEPPQ